MSVLRQKVCRIMSTTIFSIFALLLVVQNICSTIAADNYGSSYYNKKTNNDLQSADQINSAGINKINYKGVTCSCQNLGCSCCVGVRIKKLKFNKEACAKITYVPQNSAVTAAVSLDQKNIITTSLPVKSPPPLCVPVPGLSLVKVCINLSDISVSGNKLQVCPNLETHVASSTVLTMHFNCLKI